MSRVIQLLLAILVLFLGTAPLRAEEAPSQELQLRIETGMHMAGIWRLGVSADGKLSISELDEELTTRVEVLTDGKQTPVMTKPGAVKRFFLAAL
jgi:hypothetical protein